jgi:TBC1 domain family member 2
MSDYVPVDQELKQDTLARKREEYTNLVRHYFGRLPASSDTVEQLMERTSEMSAYETKNFKQIKIDVYRTQPEVKLFASQLMQTMLIRLLFVWSMRNPASAYV